MRYLFLPLALTLFISCESKDWARNDLNFAAGQLTLAMTETEKAIAENPDKNYVAPRTFNDAGKLVAIPSRDWVSGFFSGELWYMYQYTKDEKWREAAEKYTARLEPEKLNAGTHDMGFKMYCSFGNGYRLTQNEHYREVLITSAQTLVTRFKPNAGIIRSWDHNRNQWQCPVIVDNMMNLELLFFAFRETGDSTFYNIAVSHADKTIENHFREDFSTYHVVDYDTITGEIITKQTHQGYADSSAWSRGQAWAIYGFTMCYRETGDVKYLEQARKALDFVFNNKNLPADLIPYWDYDAPEIPNEPRDASAASITASALYDLCRLDAENAGKYRAWADTILENLSKHYKAKRGGDCGFLLLHSTGSKPADSEVDKPLAYADYYFLEAMLRKLTIDN
ncbi:MAG: glycoside hydrolase family 88 protein [Tannerella sp.]|jgi:rhamnogalacturonyl hydrolase YesR|nr:glycoside hydrolase family 88 protein [Tannerella sp.]